MAEPVRPPPLPEITAKVTPDLRIGLFGAGLWAKGESQLSLKFKSTGCTDVTRLSGIPPERLPLMSVGKHYFRQRGRYNLKNYDLLINLVTDADLNSDVLDVLDKLLKGLKVPVLNRPTRVRGTTREGVSRTLAGIENLIVPRVRKVRSGSPQVLRGLEASAAMKFPAILRRAGSHSGRVVGILRTPDDGDAAERASEGYYLTEFVNYRSEDGLYRKYRVFMFGGTPVFRHMIISDEWNVHAADRQRFMMSRPQVLEESQAMYEGGVQNFHQQVRDAFRAIDERLGLDFLGIDFGILPDGRVVLFEANGTMNFFPISTDPRLAAMHLCIAPAEHAFQEMIENALQTE